MILIPWLLALVTAGWFGLAARKAGRNVLPWALSGAVFALVTATIVLGLGQATGNPFSDQQRGALHLRWAAEAVVTIAILGWVFTLGLHRHHFAVWRMLTSKPLPPAVSASPADPKAKAEASKQPAKP
jgi:hypothetical protein